MPQTPEEAKLAALLVEHLNLDISPEALDPNMPLFGDEGLGLDSIDALEIGLCVSQHYGLKIDSKQAQQESIFQTLQHLNQYIEQHQ